MTTAATPTIREILAARQCSAACILSTLKPERCGCRCNGAWHGTALAALGLPSHRGGASEPPAPGAPGGRRRPRQGRRR